MSQHSRSIGDHARVLESPPEPLHEGRGILASDVVHALQPHQFVALRFDERETAERCEARQAGWKCDHRIGTDFERTEEYRIQIQQFG